MDLCWPVSIPVDEPWGGEEVFWVKGCRVLLAIIDVEFEFFNRHWLTCLS